MNPFNKSLNKYLSATFLGLTLLTAVGCGYTSTSASTIDDAAITSNVEAAILHDKALKSSQIHVESSNGVVELTGFVRSASAATRAVKLAGTIEGVKTVKNRMRTE